MQPAGNAVQLQHPALIDLIKMAYSAEKAAAFAYQGHAGSLNDADAKKAVRQIEIDEWNHRKELADMMEQYGIKPSTWYEIKFHIIGKVIAGSCYVIGWFMPIYFAGRLESGNVCEYFRMKQYFNSLGITAHDQCLYDMGIKEKEHEVYFLEMIKQSKLLPVFEKFFAWGSKKSFNNIDLDKKYPLENSGAYCSHEQSKLQSPALTPKQVEQKEIELTA